jgi:hypothetical protein
MRIMATTTVAYRLADLPGSRALDVGAATPP